jgi:D-aspartate ligase
MSSPRVAVSGAMTGSGLAAIRDVGRAGYRVVGAMFRRPVFGAHSRWSSRYLELPPPLRTEALMEILARGKVEALLPMESSLVGALARHGAAGSGRSRPQAAVPTMEGFLAAYDNRRTLETCHRLGIPAPRLLRPQDASGAVVVKPREDVGAAQGVAFCRDGAELRRALAACRAFGEPVIQEYIPGGTDAMRTAVLLFDCRTRLVAHFTTMKLEQHPAAGGLTTMSQSTDDRALVEGVLPIFESLRWCGPAEVELKVDARDGVAKLIEVNPRLPSYVAFAGDCGLHLPRLTVQVALGETPPDPGYAVGRRYVNPGLHLKALISAWQAGAVTAARLRRDVPALLTAPWLRWDDLTDPLPRLARAFEEARGVPGGLADEHRLRLTDLEPFAADPGHVELRDGGGADQAETVLQ